MVIDHLVDEAVSERVDQIADHYKARRQAMDTGEVGGGAPYKPLTADRLYLDKPKWNAELRKRAQARLTPFAQPEAATVIDMGGRVGRGFAAEPRRRDALPPVAAVDRRDLAANHESVGIIELLGVVERQARHRALRPTARQRRRLQGRMVAHENLSARRLHDGFADG